jgi:hypothetical protein
VEAALQAFLITIAIVGGVLSPFLVFTLLGIIGQILSALGQSLVNKAEEIKKAPPYDDVELNLNPATNVLTARLIKKDEIVWQGSVTRNEIEEAATSRGPFNFKKDA